MAESSLQDRYAPHNACFGCGPANDKGLRIKSRVEGEELVADWTPEPHHAGFPGSLNGGIVGALFDCHSNWCNKNWLSARKMPRTVGALWCASPHVEPN